MLQQQFDLDMLQCILSQCIDDIIRDCFKMIVKLLELPPGFGLNESVRLLDSKDRKFGVVKALLNVLEKLHLTKCNINSELPLPLIIENIKHVLSCNNENCSLPDNDVQCDILSIVSSVFHSELSQNSSKYLQELAEFYSHILTCIEADNANNQCKPDCLVFKLKIMSLIYEVLKHTMHSPSAVDFCEKLKLKKHVREGELFACMILHDDKKVAIQTLIDLIPKYINCFESGKIVEIIWHQISNCMIHSNIERSRVYIILCNFFNLCFDKSALRDQVDLALLLLNDENFWKLVQSALIDGDPMKRKQGLYLFKKAIDLLNSMKAGTACSIKKNVFYWDLDFKEELREIYSDIIITLEFLDEQQVHIIKPIFKMVETLIEKILACSKVDFSWILLVYQKALMHENIQVIKWGLSNLLKLPSNFFSHEHIIKDTAWLLVVTLNNVSLYYSDGLTISNELEVFFKRVTQLITAKTFFSLFVKEICSQVWSAEALFFVIHPLSRVGKFSFWGKEEIFEIKMFAAKAFKTHNKTIRTGVQCELLTAVLQLTDRDDVSLENVVLLLSVFPVRVVLRNDSLTWEILIDWLSKSYSKKDVKNVLEKYKKQELGGELNEKHISLMLILYFYSYFDSETEDGNIFIANYLLNIFLSYKEIHKRPYCNKSLQDQYLSIICFFYEANMNNSIQDFIKPTLPFVNDIILYIQIQSRQISSLQDFNICQLYSKAFESIIKTLVLFKMDHKGIKDFYEEISKDLEVALYSDTSSPLGLYCKMKFLRIILASLPCEPRPIFLLSYLTEKVNEPLKKNNEHREKTRDLQTLWGKINSEFLEEKWKILEYLLNKCGPFKAGINSWMSSNDLRLLCTEALNAGSYGVLHPVMLVLKSLLPSLENDVETGKIIESLWKLITERRKTEDFKLLLKHFVEMLFQEALILKGEFMQNVLIKYSDFIFSDSSLAAVNIFMKHIQKINVMDSSAFLFCHIIGKGLIFGPVQKKDEKLTNTVCSHIMSLKICQVEEMSDSLGNEIRGRAFQKILMLNRRLPSHQTVASNLITTLLKMENEINKNRIRYFGDSHVHRIKHRVLQALLLLEPLLRPNETQAEELFNWVHSCLVRDDSQPSVRYMQEWLLVRMLLRHSELYGRFSVNNSYNQFREIKKKGLCSLFAVTFHLCKLIPSDLMEEKILSEMSTILPFCFHQHFEVRLCAQAILLNVYEFAERKNLFKVTKEFKTIKDWVTECFSREDSKGNFNMNLDKLSKNFYFSAFNPLEHYSLETIFTDLPRLANVGSDEWISTKTFQFCGVDSGEIDIPLTNNQDSLKNSFWLNYNKINFNSLNEREDEKSEDVLENYQKKMIPMKPLVPDWDDKDQNSVKKDGLVVVASLIDRIPNLGGLARTCEIFGATQFIINSLKYIEDKQFTSLSVTAEKWIPVKEVKIQNLLDYIFEMKQSGYSVIGAEQALYSQPLGSVKFPKKSLLLLGNEKEGIPSNLLPLLDICVEVPQLGIIRSLNVHVTGALFIWEYAKQNHFS